MPCCFLLAHHLHWLPILLIWWVPLADALTIASSPRSCFHVDCFFSLNVSSPFFLHSVTIFRRDDSGDHVLLSDYRGRVSVVKDAAGNMSLHILNLEVSDKGTYICQVTWRDSSDNLIVREITTELKIVKVAATKPIIRAGKLGLTVPTGARTSLTCVASGSPPISYRWFRGTPGQKALLLSRQAELVWDSLQPSDTGKYYCEAENRAGAGAVQQSDAVELTVTGESQKLLSLVAYPSYAKAASDLTGNNLPYYSRSASGNFVLGLCFI
uniref:Uncharacterized protein n=1 Tax=Melopsittacus undulatus TaxID=13146 RepID=A0A8V5FWL7_MELUD